MKAQCERCRDIVALEFRPRPDGMDVHCPSCSADYFVPAPAAAAPAASPAPVPAEGGMTCPKCDERQSQAAACRRCGLILANWRGFEAAADSSELPIADAQKAAALWTEVTGAWTDPVRHEAFIAHCRETGAYAFAAGKYRTRGLGDSIAAGRLQQIRTLAEHSLLRPRPVVSTAERSLFRSIFMVAVFILFAAAGVGLVWKLLGSSSRAP